MGSDDEENNEIEENPTTQNTENLAARRRKKRLKNKVQIEKNPLKFIFPQYISKYTSTYFKAINSKHASPTKKNQVKDSAKNLEDVRHKFQKSYSFANTAHKPKVYPFQLHQVAEATNNQLDQNKQTQQSYRQENTTTTNNIFSFRPPNQDQQQQQQLQNNMGQVEILSAQLNQNNKQLLEYNNIHNEYDLRSARDYKSLQKTLCNNKNTNDQFDLQSAREHNFTIKKYSKQLQNQLKYKYCISEIGSATQRFQMNHEDLVSKLTHIQNNNNNQQQALQDSPNKSYISEIYKYKTERGVGDYPIIHKSSLQDGVNYVEKNQQQLDNSVSTCLICFDKEPNAVFMDCGHGGICMECAEEIVLKTGECYLCRKEIKQILLLDLNDKHGNQIKVIGVGVVLFNSTQNSPRKTDQNQDSDDASNQ